MPRKLFSQVGKRTEVFQRFWTIAGERGAAEAERDTASALLKNPDFGGLTDGQMAKATVRTVDAAITKEAPANLTNAAARTATMVARAREC